MTGFLLMRMMQGGEAGNVPAQGPAFDLVGVCVAVTVALVVARAIYFKRRPNA